MRPSGIRDHSFALRPSDTKYGNDGWTNFDMCLATALASLNDGMALHAVNRSGGYLLGISVNASEEADPSSGIFDSVSHDRFVEKDHSQVLSMYHS